MSNPLHADFYPDRAVQVAAEIIENVRQAKDTYRVRFHAPQIARRITPGQFVMLRIAGVNDPLIGRPLALYDTVLSPTGEPTAVDVVYLVKGKLTSRLWQMQPGQVLDIWGPLGNGFCAVGNALRGVPGADEGSGFGVQGSGRNRGPESQAQSVLGTQYSEPGTRDGPGPPSPIDHLIMVAGGIGQTPFLALAQEALGMKRYGNPPRVVPRAERISFCYGARTADYLADVEDFQRLGIDVRFATDDGSRGHRGFVTDVLREVLAENRGPARIVCCGPEPMMAAAAKIAAASNIPCQVSLETPMACGIGICFTCVAKVKQPSGGWDYKRTCVEGPVFDAEQIEW